jgi:hypothetical protein
VREPSIAGGGIRQVAHRILSSDAVDSNLIARVCGSRGRTIPLGRRPRAGWLKRSATETAKQATQTVHLTI